MSTDTIGFNGGGEFYSELKQRVKEHVSAPGAERKAKRQLYVKTFVIFAWAAASWTLMVFFANNWWQAGLCALSLGLAVAGIGFNVTHDANHGSYSNVRWLNRWMRWSLDVIGASSYVWRIKHNVVHHTYTNIAGADSDIEQLPFLRLAPDQKRRYLHRYQHIYAWFLYGFFAIKWQIIGDLMQLKLGRIEETPLPWPRGKELVGFWVGKAIFLTWTVAIPLFFHPVWVVALGFFVASFILAFTIALTFQLAHCVEEASFTTIPEMAEAGRVEWARHQVETTVDFAPKSRLLAWYMGGLNFQIEHHLFTKVCHTHYPKLAPIVQEVCERHGVHYQVHRTLAGALNSHVRWLRRMGRAVPTPDTAALPQSA